jgi:hypothetical protein
MKNEMKFCKDCIYCDNEKGYALTCSCPRHPKATDYATGITTIRWTYCNVLREDNFLASLFMGTCGKSARFFKPILKNIERRHKKL